MYIYICVYVYIYMYVCIHNIYIYLSPCFALEPPCFGCSKKSSVTTQDMSFPWRTSKGKASPSSAKGAVKALKSSTWKFTQQEWDRNGITLHNHRYPLVN